MEAALDVLGYLDRFHEEIPIVEGEIIKIDSAGSITRDHFQPPVNISPFYDCYDYYDEFWDSWEETLGEPVGYRKYLMDFAIAIGVPKQELDYLHRIGVSDFEMEECIYNKNYRRMLLLDTGFYNQMEESVYEIHNCSESLP